MWYLEVAVFAAALVAIIRCIVWPGCRTYMFSVLSVGGVVKAVAASAMLIWQELIITRFNINFGEWPMKILRTIQSIGTGLSLTMILTFLAEIILILIVLLKYKGLELLELRRTVINSSAAVLVVIIALVDYHFPMPMIYSNVFIVSFTGICGSIALKVVEDQLVAKFSHLGCIGDADKHLIFTRNTETMKSIIYPLKRIFIARLFVHLASIIIFLVTDKFEIVDALMDGFHNAVLMETVLLFVYITVRKNLSNRIRPRAVVTVSKPTQAR